MLHGWSGRPKRPLSCYHCHGPDLPVLGCTGGLQGGFRGFSISLWTEALALLNGGPFIDGSDVDEAERGPLHEPGLQSFTLLVLDPAAFTADPAAYQQVRSYDSNSCVVAVESTA